MSFKEYARPPVVHDSGGDVIFQMVDAEYSMVGPLNKEYSSTIGVPLDKAPVVRFFGLNKHGNSVTCHIHGFLPYFYVKPDRQLTEWDCEAIKDALEDRLATEVTIQGKSNQYVISVKLVEKMSIMYYTEETSQFLRITLSTPKHIPLARQLFETGAVQVWSIHDGELQFSPTTYESNFPFVMRLMTDTDTACGQWIKLSKGKYSHRGDNNRQSTSQIEVDTQWDYLEPMPFQGEFNDIAPLRILSFDIECTHRKGIFPEANQDAVVCISAEFETYGSTEPPRGVRLMFKDSDPCEGVDVRWYDTEQQMLTQWSEFITQCDPDIITGWNIAGFDSPYLLARAEALKLKRFKHHSRMKESKVTAVADTFESKAYGKRDGKKVTIPGRVHMDAMQFVMREKKLRVYSLNAVSKELLNDTKDDFDSRMIPDYFDGPKASKATRSIYGRYCDKDRALPPRILKKLMAIPNNMEMVRLTKVLLNTLFTQGQQIKVIAQIHRKGNPEGYIIPTPVNSGKGKKDGDDGGVAYEGAIVIPPKRGFYQKDQPIATLDFASLYPSIMMANNLCYSTLIRPADIHKYPPEIYKRSPYNDSPFVLPSKKKGVLTRLLEDLIGGRKKAKEDLEAETDPFRKAALDARQLALKLSANSVYGFTGAMRGRLPCIEISASVTAYGRDMITLTRNYVINKYNKANGYQHDADVVYGDTDSVMIKFGTADIKEAMQFGKEACALITAEFPRPVKLEFEKVYAPYLLINKKRYAGQKWEADSKSPTGLKSKSDVKGMECVRRDSCPLLKDIEENALKQLIVENSPKGAFDYAVSKVGQLIRGEVDLSQLVITKAVSRTEEQYHGKQVHIEAVKRAQERDGSVQLVLGDRPAYIMVKHSVKGTKTHERSEDPVYVIKNKVPVDTQWYLSNQLEKPLRRIFEYIEGIDVNKILSGEHTRHVTITEQVEDPRKNTITKMFTKRKYHCLVCNVTVKDNTEPVCPHCTEQLGVDKAQLKRTKTERLAELQQKADKLWAECVDCQVKSGGLQQPEDCSNSQCTKFYRRYTARNDAQSMKDTINKYQW